MTATTESIEDVVARLASTTWNDKAALTAEGCIRVAEAVRFAGLGRTQLYVLMSHGLPFIKAGSARLIPRKAIVDLLAELAAK